MLKQLRLRPVYFTLLFIILAIAVFICLALSKKDSFLLLNFYHSYWLDQFFVYYTYAGDGFVSVAAVIILLCFKKWKEAVTLLTAYVTSGLAAQLLKNIFTEPRPRLYFTQTFVEYHNFIEQVTLSNNSSFPSGHTASAFAMATVLALIYKSNKVAVISLMAAVLVGYSRIYIGQHFLQDVMTGAFLGVFFAMLSYYLTWQRKTIKLFTKKI